MHCEPKHPSDGRVDGSQGNAWTFGPSTSLSLTVLFTKPPDCLPLGGTLPVRGSHSQPMDIFRPIWIAPVKAMERPRAVRPAASWIALLISQIFKRLLFTKFHFSKTFCIPLISKSHFTIQSRLQINILQVIEPEDNGYATCWEDVHFYRLSSGIPMYGAFPLYRTWCCTSIITSNKTLAAPSTNLGRFPQNELQSSEKKRCQFVIVTLLSKRFKIIPSAT